MKALTLHQPWATAIAIGLKKFETRPRSLKYRGPIAIHAGKKQPDPKIINDLTQYIPLQYRYSWGTVFPLGAVVAIAEITDCQQMTDEMINTIPTVEKMFGNWEPGRYAYSIENVKMLSEPVLVKGAQGLWNLDDSLVENYL